MLRSVAVMILLAVHCPASAQSLFEGVQAEQLMRQNIKMKKKEILAQAMDLSEKDSRTFWQIYREYEGEIGKLNDAAFALLDQYTKGHEKLSDPEAGQITAEGFELDKKRLAVREKYFRRMSKALSPRAASRFVQLETLLHNVVALQMAMNISLVE